MEVLIQNKKFTTTDQWWYANEVNWSHWEDKINNFNEQHIPEKINIVSQKKILKLIFYSLRHQFLIINLLGSGYFSANIFFEQFFIFLSSTTIVGIKETFV